MTVGERRRLNREREDRDIEMMRQRQARSSVPELHLCRRWIPRHSTITT